MCNVRSHCYGYHHEEARTDQLTRKQRQGGGPSVCHFRLHRPGPPSGRGFLVTLNRETLTERSHQDHVDVSIYVHLHLNIKMVDVAKSKLILLTLMEDISTMTEFI